MNREIKFRAWVEDFAPDYGEKKESVMFYSDRANTTYMTGDRSLLCCGGSAPKGVLQSFLEDPRTKVMQYTGLKDKTGKEIYESDLVRCTSKEHSSQNGVKEVVFADFAWRMRDFDCHAKPQHALSFSWCWTSFEIIGNIYENPGLLTPQ